MGRRRRPVGLFVLALVGAGGFACKKQEDRSTPAAAAEVPTADTAVEAPDPLAPVASDPGFDAVAEALEIDTVTPGVIWLGADATREIFFVLAMDAWRLEPVEGGVALRVGAASRLAARLGLQDGDVVCALGDTPVRGRADARAAMTAFASGERVSVKLRRDGEERQLFARAVDAGSSSARHRVEDILAAGLRDEPEPTIERAVLVGLGGAQARLSRQPELVLELLGLPAEAADISLDGASVAREDLARALGAAATAEHLRISAGSTTVSRRIVSGSVEASDLESAIGRLPPPPRPRSDPGTDLLDTAFPGSGLGEVPQGDPPIEGIEHVDEAHVRITRELLDSWLSDPSTLAKSARIVPSQKDGVIEGFKIYGVRRGSPAKALGFKNGDMITEVAGRSMTDVTAAMEAFDDVRKAKKVTVTLVRKGASMTVQYEVVATL